MIKSYKEITGKYLKANKKRTALTLIGIILSVSLISAIGFFLRSMQEAQILNMKNSYGSWHVMYEKVDDSLITKIKSNPVVLRSGTYATGNEINISDNLKAREVFGSDDGLKLLPYKLKEGRFAVTKAEVAVERWFLDRIKSDGKLGDRIEIIGKEYTLVGILNDTYRTQSEGVGELLTNDPGVNNVQRILLVELNPDRKLQKNINELKKLSAVESVVENGMLIRVQGQGMPMGILAILGIIIGIVVISTIAVIYNAFQIGVVDRIKQFGLLRAVGSTPKQIRKIILKEATLLASIGVPIGLGFGIAALYGINFVFKIIGDNFTLISPRISLDVVIISILIGLGSIYISALLPAIFAGRISPLVAISSRNSISKEKLKRRKSLIIGKIFGFEGALASKNIKRNRKRYRITVFSIVISVTLFISFKSFMDMSLNVYSESNESNKMHFSVSGYDGNTKIEENFIKKINKLPQVDVSYRVYNPEGFEAVVDKAKEIREIKEIGEVYKEINYKGENKTLMSSSVIVYDDKALEAAKAYLKEGTIDIESLNRENGVLIIGKNRIFNSNTKRSFYGPVINLRSGDEVLLQLSQFTGEGNKKYEFGQRKITKVKVLAVLEGAPFDFFGNGSGIKIITTRDVATRLGSKSINPVGLDIKLRDTRFENEAKKGIENLMITSNNLKFINIIDQNRTITAVTLMAKILLYGFVVVVSLIGSVNIINTLTTNIILRRREFAALKSIGLTQRGLRKMISLEGILYGIVGSFYGSVIGVLLSYMLYRGVSDIREQSYKLPLASIAIATAGAMIIGCLSVLAPIKRMKKDNLIEAVRDEY